MCLAKFDIIKNFKNIPVFNAWLDPFSREKMGWVFHNSSQNSNNQNTPKLLLIKNFNITCIDENQLLSNPMSLQDNSPKLSG